MLFYEKLNSFEEDAEYEKRKEFSYVKLELSTMLRLAQQVDLESGDFGSQGMIAEQ